MAINTTTGHDELIIKDGQVYNREIFETPLGCIDKLINEALVPKNHKIIPIKFPSVLRTPWCLGHWFAESQDGNLFVVTEIAHMEFKGCTLLRDESKTYTLSTSSKGQCPEEDFNPRTLDDGTVLPPLRLAPLDGVKWMLPKDCRLFVLTQGSEEPYLFLVSKNHAEPMRPNLPNIFKHGAICTGPTYHDNVSTSGVGAPVGQRIFAETKVALDIIRTAPANKDLRSNDRDFFVFVPTDDGEGVRQVEIPWEGDHGHPITDSRVLQFVTQAKL